ncbi:MAG: hypothetical protein DI551_05825 [Micavibrio aeruginosavorus]|uniref:Uncharacterized protein n=1 Tax=Micavibrio aeruginosavorus TaxID=349221 RepID=A0A2W5MZ39_9BACT|nr:MAG: hypothetical protein DI551_05825 [Micavibrio aeruginosavorus]
MSGRPAYAADVTDEQYSHFLASWDQSCFAFEEDVLFPEDPKQATPEYFYALFMTAAVEATKSGATNALNYNDGKTIATIPYLLQNHGEACQPGLDLAYERFDLKEYGMKVLRNLLRIGGFEGLNAKRAFLRLAEEIGPDSKGDNYKTKSELFLAGIDVACAASDLPSDERHDFLKRQVKRWFDEVSADKKYARSMVVEAAIEIAFSDEEISQMAERLAKLIKYEQKEDMVKGYIWEDIPRIAAICGFQRPPPSL